MIFYEKKQKETGKEYAYRVLKGNIMSLELKPGELLSESDLSEKLNISRTPIREIIMILKGEHLIEVKPQAGTYVSLIDRELIDEAIFKGTANQQRIITGYLENKLFPLPPLQEQDRIVTAINAVASIMRG